MLSVKNKKCFFAYAVQPKLQQKDFTVIGPIKILHVFGADVAIGAVAGYYYAMTAVGAAFHWYHAAVLCLSILFLYNLDHYLDSRRAIDLMPVRLGDRRSLHIRYSKFLLPVSLSSAIIAAMITLIFFPLSLIVSGLVFSAAILLYYTAIHQIKMQLPKELVAAIGYSLGCWLPALHYGFVGNPFHIGYLLILLHSLAALANLISYSIIDNDEDIKIGMNSTLRIEQLRSYRFVIPVLAIAMSIIFLFAGLSTIFVLPILFVIFFQTFLPYLTRDTSLARLYGENFFTIIFIPVIF